MTAIRRACLDVSVLVSSELVSAEVRDGRPDTLVLFGDLSETHREQLVHDAWSIGLRALRNAQSQAQESRLQDIGATLTSDIERQLRAHVDLQQQTIAAVLA